MVRTSSVFCRFLICAASITAAFGQGSGNTLNRPVRNLDLLAGQGTVLDFDADVTRVYSSNTDIADPAVFTAREVVLNAKAPGIATVVIWLQSGVRETFAARVSFDLGSARALLRETFPGEDVNLYGSKDGLSLVGRASSQEISDRAVALLKPLAQSVVSNLQIAPARVLKQIGLKVIFAEVNRKVSQEFGVNFLSTGGKMFGAISTGQFPGLSPEPSGTGLNLSDALNIFAFRPDLNLAVTIKDLEQRGLLEILAEPNLVTSNGKEARFMVGGEFPVPVPQAGSVSGAITIQFREFGIRLAFLPTITANGTIRLHVLPEVSTIDLVNGVILNGFSIPALSTRRVETDIELSEGQSFAIAGLMDDRVTENLARVPGLADIPFFGALFRSRQRTKSKTELVVLITPTTRQPLPDGKDLPIPAMPAPFLPPLPNPSQSKGGSGTQGGEANVESEAQSTRREEMQRDLIRSLMGMFEGGQTKPSDVLIRQVQELSARYGSEHPKVIQAADAAALALEMEEESEKGKDRKEKSQ